MQPSLAGGVADSRTADHRGVERWIMPPDRELGDT